MSIEEQARQVAKALGLPETLIPLNTIVVGYHDTEVSPKDKWHEGSISYNQYGTVWQSAINEERETVSVNRYEEIICSGNRYDALHQPECNQEI